MNEENSRAFHSLSLEEEGANVAVSVVFGAEEEGNKFLFYIIKKQIK